MRKVMITVLILVVSIIVTTVGVFAEADNLNETAIEKEGGTRYTYFSNTRAWLDITGSTASWSLKATKMNQYDSATVTTSLIKKNSGTVATYTNTFYNSSINISKNRTISSHGTYYVQFTIRCYKGGSLKETITVTTGSDTY